MSIPNKILQAVAEKPRGKAKNKGARLDKAAAIVQDFATERSLAALDTMLAGATALETAPETEGAPNAAEALSYCREAAEISEQTEILARETNRFLASHGS